MYGEKERQSDQPIPWSSWKHREESDSAWSRQGSEANWWSKWWDPIVAREPNAQEEPDDPWGHWCPGAQPPERGDSKPDAEAPEPIAAADPAARGTAAFGPVAFGPAAIRRPHRRRPHRGAGVAAPTAAPTVRATSSTHARCTSASATVGPATKGPAQSQQQVGEPVVVWREGEPDRPAHPLAQLEAQGGERQRLVPPRVGGQ